MSWRHGSTAGNELTAEEAEQGNALQLALKMNEAVCALRSGDAAAALRHADSAVALSPSSPRAHFRRGQALQALGRTAEAEEAYTAVLERNPGNREATEALAALRGGAAGAVTAAAEAKPSEKDSLLSASEVAELKKMGAAQVLAHIEGVKSSANAAFKRGEPTACASYARGTEMLQYVPPDDLSEAEYEQAVALELALKLNEAACALKAGDAAASLGHADQAVEMSEGASPKAHFRRAQALAALGRKEAAAEAYQTVVKLDPSNREAAAQLQALRGGGAVPPPALADQALRAAGVGGGCRARRCREAGGAQTLEQLLGGGGGGARRAKAGGAKHWRSCSVAAPRVAARPTTTS